MGRGDLPALILQDIAQCALQNAGPPAAFLIEARGVLSELRARASGLDANHAYAFVFKERMEQAD